MPRQHWPLVAREEELETLLTMVETGGAVVVGQPGVGKSRLASEATQRLVERGWVVVSTAATAALGSIPFGALAELAPDAREHVAAGSSVGVLQSIASELRRRCAGGPVLLFVDDAHLLDEASAAALLHVARSGAAAVLVTVRRGEPGAELVQPLWREEIVDRLDLQAIGRRDVDDLLVAVLGGAVDPGSVHRLHHATGGNLLLLREVVRAAQVSGGFTNADGVWRWDQGALQSPRLRELVQSRIGARRSDEILALELVALGEPLERDLLVTLAGRAAVESLESDGLLVTSADNRRMSCRMIHPIYSNVIAEQMVPTTARDLRRRLASAVEATGARRRNDVLRVAAWRLQAGESLDADTALRAAAIANRLFDPILAGRLGQVALDAGAGLAAAIALATAHAEQNRFAAAEDVLQAYEDDVQGFEDALAFLPRRTQVLTSLSRDDHALAVLDRFDRRASDRRERHLVAALRADVHAHRREWDLALKYGRPVLEDDDVDERVMLLAVNPVSMTLCLQGLTDTCLALGEKAVEPALRLLKELPDALGWATASRVSAMLYAARFDELDEFLSSVYEDALARGDDALVAQITLALGSSCLSRGLCAQAVSWLSRAAAALRFGDTAGYRRMCFALLAEAHAIAGDVVEAERALADSLEFPSIYATLASEEAIVAAWLAARSGDPGRGQSILIAAAGAGTFPPVEEAQLLHHAVRLGASDGAALARLADLADGCEAATMLAWGAHATALVEGSGAALEPVAHRFAALTMWLVAAEAAAQSAAAFHREGLQSSARRMETLSAAWFAKAEAAPTPLMQNLHAPAELSRRERDVAMLAASGLTNSEIAERLYLSVRTVESHLYRAFGKLGVARREELAQLLT